MLRASFDTVLIGWAVSTLATSALLNDSQATLLLIRPNNRKVVLLYKPMDEAAYYAKRNYEKPGCSGVS